MLDSSPQQRNINQTVSLMGTETELSSPTGGNDSKAKPEIKTCFVWSLMTTISLGMFLFGYCIASWGDLQSSFQAKYNWGDTEYKNWQSGITTVTNLGSMIGSLCTPSFTKYGKRKMILYTNLMVCVGCGLCLIDNIWVIAVGRFVFGMSAGAFSVFCPMFITETSPTELIGPMGALNQLQCTLGILCAALFGLAVPADPQEALVVNPTDFYVLNWYRVMWSFPLAIVLLQTLLLVFVFKYDTPVYLKSKDNHDDLMSLLSKMYPRTQVLERAALINTGQQEGVKEREISYRETFCDPVIRRAAWVGVSLSIFQQLSGINAIIFYSSQIFSQGDIQLSPNQANALVMAINFVATIPGLMMLNCFGRKSLMIVWTIVMTIFLYIMGVATISGWTNIELICTCGFVAAFEFAQGPIVWLYMSEIMTDKGMAVGCTANWAGTLIVGLLTPYLLGSEDNPGWLNGYTFILFGGFSTIAAVFFIFFMKETKGLSQAQVAKLYRTDNYELEEEDDQRRSYSE